MCQKLAVKPLAHFFFERKARDVDFGGHFEVQGLPDLRFRVLHRRNQVKKPISYLQQCRLEDTQLL
jgi:hypothetical protein